MSSLETGNSDAASEASRKPQEDREALIAGVTVPFETIALGETLKKYPEVFARFVERNWAQVCELMDWKKDGEALNYSIFKLAKDPAELVKTIQTKIIETGGALPKYGVDGKFGQETETGLKAALKPDTLVATAAKPKEPAEEPSDRLDAPEVKLEAAKRDLGKFQLLLEPIGKAERRLEAAGLRVKDLASQAMTPEFVSDYRKKARSFRETLGRENPLLAKVTAAANQAVDILSEEIKKVDFSKIKTVEDLIRWTQEFTQTLEAKFKTIQEPKLTTDEEKEVQTMMEDFKEFKNLDRLELPMAFILSLVGEVAVIATEHFQKNKEGIEALAQLLKKEYFLSTLDSPDRLDSNPFGRSNLDAIIPTFQDSGPKETGSVYYGLLNENGQQKSLSFDLDNGSAVIGDREWKKLKEAKIILPAGTELVRLQTKSNGSIEVTGSLGGLEQAFTISALELSFFFQKVNAGESGTAKLAGLDVKFEQVSVTA